MEIEGLMKRRGRREELLRQATMLVLAVFMAGCGGDEGNDGPAVAAFEALSAYDVLKGKVTIRAEASRPTRLELVAGGQSVGILSAPPYAFAWDTAAAPDGLLELVLRAHGSSGVSQVDRVKVILLNRGAEAVYQQGVNTGAVTIPQSGVDDTHVAFTWMMPGDGIKKVLALLFWTESSFDMELSMGVGCCASSGRVGASGKGATAPLVVTFVDSKEMPLPLSTKWFVDASVTNPAQVAGKKTDLTAKVYLLK